MSDIRVIEVQMPAPTAVIEVTKPAAVSVVEVIVQGPKGDKGEDTILSDDFPDFTLSFDNGLI